MNGLSLSFKKKLSFIILLCLILGACKNEFKQARSSIEVLFLDTALCSDEQDKKFNLSKINLTNISCTNQLHAFKFLKELKKYLIISPNKIHLYHISIFDEKQSSNLKRWKQAIDIIKKKRFHLVVSSSGLFTDFKKLPKWPKSPLSIFPTGTRLPGLKKSIKLWPQFQKTPNMLLVSTIKPSKNIKNSFLLLPNEMKEHATDYYVEQKKGSLQGNSQSVAIFTASVINNCFKSIQYKKQIKKCINNLSKEEFTLNQKKIKVIR